MKNEMRSNQLYFMKSKVSNKCSNISVWSFFFMFLFGFGFWKTKDICVCEIAKYFSLPEENFDYAISQTLKLQGKNCNSKFLLVLSVITF